MKKLGWLFGKKTPAYHDERGDLELYEEDYGQTNYDDEWNQVVEKKNSKQSDFNWDSYKKEGSTWKGYRSYRPAQLSYSYVEQMANAIATQQDVNVKVGKSWEVDLEKKILTYNPMTLMFGTRGELLATLLHEVGKIRLGTPYKKLVSPSLTKYKLKAYEIGAIYDDFRVDNKMIDSYPSASEVYKSQGAILARVVDLYGKTAEAFRVRQIGILVEFHKNINTHVSQGKDFKTIWKAMFGQDAPFKDNDAFKDFITDQVKNPRPNLYDYIAATIARGYGVSEKGLRPDMLARFSVTAHVLDQIVKAKSTQEVIFIMEDEVYPNIKDLLESDTNGSKELRDAVGDQTAKDIMEAATPQEGSALMDRQGKTKSRMTATGRGEENIPQEWTKGDYEPLRESVQSEIRSLYSKLVTIRRKENVVRYETEQRRGKLNTKSLYKFSTGNQRLFKKKHETTDTIRSFVFSILVDASGSMQGARQIHTTRSMIMLAEVFEKLGMPYEIIHFEDSPSITKSFETPLKSVKRDLAGYADRSGGGTILANAIKASNITKRTELNRVLVILTDGDVEGDLDQKYFKPLLDKNIQVIPIGIECTKDRIEKLAFGRGKYVDLPAEIPQVFYDMLKTLINKAQITP